MGKLTVLWLLLAALSSASTDEKVTPAYFTDGGKLTLDVRPAYTEHIGSILWKTNRNLLAEWIENTVPLNYYGVFKGRTTLSVTTGRLTIENMTKFDMGVYVVEINNKVHRESYDAVLIKVVPRPEVLIRTLTCTAQSEDCKVSCDADTAGAEPVTYSWESADGKWTVSEKDTIITRADNASMKTLTCRIKNPVSEEESKPEANPLYSGEGPGGAVIGGVLGGLFAIFAAVVVVAAVAWKFKKGPFKNRGVDTGDVAPGVEQPTTPPSDTPDKPAEELLLHNKPDGNGAEIA